MKVIIAPDKFKGSLTSFEVCKSIEAGIKPADRNAEVYSFPMADGGDGFAAVLQYYLKTQTIYCPTVDPLYRSIKGSYQWDELNQTAIIELAVASGLVLLKDEERNPLLTSTFGTGLLIKDAIEKGAKKIILGLGGSATNDAGTGILKALGFVFFDAGENELQPSGGSLALIQKIAAPSILPEITFDIACDVQNVLYGQNGAAFIYAPQKGAREMEVLQLDKGLKHFHEILFQQTGKKVADIPGTGAAGGIAAGLMGYFVVHLKKGTEMVIDASRIGDVIQHADIVFTGEGKIDDQSKEGKVVARIAALARQSSIPVIGLCGALQLDVAGIKQLGLSYASAICKEPSSLQTSINHASDLLEQKASLIFLLCLSLFKKEERKF
jgi:glycerate kinase